MPDQPPKPRPHGVWLSVSLANLELTKAQRLTNELLGLRGQHAHQTGGSRIAIRYTYEPERCAQYANRATALLKAAGIRNPSVVAFEIWRTTFRLAKELDIGRRMSLAMAIEGLRQVLETSSNDAGSIFMVDFKGIPSVGVLHMVHGYVVPYLP